MLIYYLSAILGCTHYHINKGIEESTLNHFAKSLSHFSKAEKNENDRAFSFFESAKIFEKLKQFDIAIDFYKRAINEVQKNENSYKLDYILNQINKKLVLENCLDKKFNSIEYETIPISVKLKYIHSFFKKSSVRTYHPTTEYECNLDFLKIDCVSNIYGDLYTTYTHISNQDDEFGSIVDKKGKFIKFKRRIYCPIYSSWKQKVGARKLWFNINDIKLINTDQISECNNIRILPIKDRIDAYNSFLKEFPNTKHKILAKKRIDDLSFELAKESDSITLYTKYLTNFSNGQHTNKAKEKIDILSFDVALKRLIQ